MVKELDVKLDDGLPHTGVVRSTVSVANGNEVGGAIDFGAGGTAGFEMLVWDNTLGAPVCVTAPGTAGATWNVDSDNSRCNAITLY